MILCNLLDRIEPGCIDIIESHYNDASLGYVRIAM